MSFKNTKSIFRRKNGSPFIATKPERKSWMVQAAHLIASQLRSASRIEGGETIQECWKRFATYWLPPDDSWLDMEIGSVKTILVPKGEEGVDIMVEILDDGVTASEVRNYFAAAYQEQRKENL